MAELINLGIDPELVKPVLEKQIQAAIMGSLGDINGLFDYAIKAALNQRVNEDGRVSNYSSENRYDFLEALSAKAVREAAKEAMKEYINENKAILKRKLKAEMKKKANQDKLVQAFVDAASESFNYSWTFNAKVELAKKEEF